MSNTSTGLFDDLVETANQVEAAETEQVNTETETTEVEETSKRRGARKLPDVERPKITVQDVSEIPAGYVSVKTFAFTMTQRNFQNRIENGQTPTENDMVPEQLVYISTQAKRHTIPSAQLVLPSGTEVRGGVVLPLEAAMAAWDARPERGEGTGRGPLDANQIEARVLRAGKAHSRLAKLEKQVKRYGELLEEVGKTWQDAKEAYAEWVSSQEEEIADDE
jgi:hypothetical protein